MSLYLPDQKLGSRSQPGSSSHKFVLKGRQTGSMHRGHTWVFRAETYETMLAWYDDIKNLTEKSGEERNAFVRRHASVRSTSAGSNRSRASSDGALDEDEADAVPYSANQSIASQAIVRDTPARPSPGGRFPSDLNVNRNLQAPLSPSSGSSEINHDLTTAAGGPHQDIHPMYLAGQSNQPYAEPVQPVQHQQQYPAADYVNSYPPTQQQYHAPDAYANQYTSPQQVTSRAMDNYANSHPYDNGTNQFAAQPAPNQHIERHESNYGNWMAPAAGGAAAGALAGEAYHRKQMEQQEREQQEELDRQARFQDQNSRNIVPPAPVPAVTGPAPAVPERDPDHHVPEVIPEVPIMTTTNTQPASAPTAFIPVHTQDRGLITPSTANTSFLDDSEIGMAVPSSGKTINGGPVPVELVQVAEAHAHPGMHRTNTDISVSDLHVPGEYPKVAKAAVPMQGVKE